jgi:hypothetical protein
MFNSWMLKRRLAECRRPRMARALAWQVAAVGLILITEGVIVAWFLPRFAPEGWGLELINLVTPWARVSQWLAGALMMAFGMMGVASGFQMPRHRQLGAYLDLGLIGVLLVTGAVLLYGGIRYEAAWLVGGGAVDIGLGLLLAGQTGLCWYTLDPLGLHWEPGS